MAEFILSAPLRRFASTRPRLRRLLWRIDYLFIWSLIRLFQLLPVDMASRLGARVGGWIGPVMKRKTALFRDNFAVALPELSAETRESIVRDAWRQGGRILAEYPHIPSLDADPRRIVVDDSAFDIAAHQPCILVIPHLSNWEIPPLMLKRYGVPNACLYAPPSNPLLDQMLLDSRRKLGCELIPRITGARALMRALKSGKTLGLVVDRRVDEGQPLRFFGHEKLSTLLPARLALKHGAPLVPLHIERLEDARFRITVLPPLTPAEGLDEEGQAIDMMQRLHELFEDWIRTSPSDWLCSKRLWQKGTLEGSKTNDSP
jgi:KDO2-lipid IV(A) lauroyltransferase